jgi:peptide-methionine (S)-S-oxide reductase
MTRIFRSFPSTVMLVALLVLAGLAIGNFPAAADSARVVPAPMVDAPPGQATSAVVVLAGGCFWGVQGVFQHVKGVTNAVSGYAGGDRKSAEYETVSSGRTGHAESAGHVRPSADQLRANPTDLLLGRPRSNRAQSAGPDTGTQYRSAIFPVNAEQADVAKAYIAQLDQAHSFKKPIVTRIEPDRAFYPAENYHQDFLTRNPRNPYIAINDLPKIEDLKRLLPELYRATPVLVAGVQSSRN